MKKLVSATHRDPYPIWQVAARAATRRLENAFKRIELTSHRGGRRQGHTKTKVTH